MCGENALPPAVWARLRGSSPRVRGKLELLRLDASAVRLIPACAGKTRQRCASRFVSGAHPRVCGENLVDEKGKRCGNGSSPRVRGKLCSDNINKVRCRLIPACAGKTQAIEMTGLLSTAHPRVCGENLSCHRLLLVQQGSSPRVRGKPPLSETSARSSRLIPACAGKTNFARVYDSLAAAHPRVCGENNEAGRNFSGHRGSSPRVRGKPLFEFSLTFRSRLIPACAGKTCRGGFPLRRDRAHPRVCGENSTLSETCYP